MLNSMRVSARSLRAAAALAVTFASLPALAGNSILVPQQHATIQAAINAAQSGDMVIVAPGVYSGAGNRDIDLLGKAITVKSAQGAATCTISVGGTQQEYHTGFALAHNYTNATVIDGFTITGGYKFNGGGIEITAGSPVIQNCVLTGNSCDCWGAGVYSQSNATPRIVNCRIVGNVSGDDGGGVFTISSNARVENCVIAGNSSRNGAGVCVFGGQPTFVNCRITSNTVTQDGCTVLYMWARQLVNCTIAGNSAGPSGSAVYLAGGGSSVVNSIIWGNSGAQVANQTAVTFSIVQGGMAGVGNSAADPQFNNAAAGDFRVRATSPAIDSGSSLAVPAGVTTDLAGNKRVADHPLMPDTGVASAYGAVVDRGAYEFGSRAVGSTGMR